MSTPFAMLPHAIAFDRRLSPLDVRVALGLLYLGIGRPTLEHSDEVIAAAVDTSIPSVRRSLDRLQTCGLIARTRTRPTASSMAGRIITLVWIEDPAILEQLPLPARSLGKAAGRPRAEKAQSPVIDPSAKGHSSVIDPSAKGSIIHDQKGRSSEAKRVDHPRSPKNKGLEEEKEKLPPVAPPEARDGVGEICSTGSEEPRIQPSRRSPEPTEVIAGRVPEAERVAAEVKALAVALGCPDEVGLDVADVARVAILTGRSPEWIRDQAVEVMTDPKAKQPAGLLRYRLKANPDVTWAPPHLPESDDEDRRMEEKLRKQEASFLAKAAEKAAAEAWPTTPAGRAFKGYLWATNDTPLRRVAESRFKVGCGKVDAAADAGELWDEILDLDADHLIRVVECIADHRTTVERVRRVMACDDSSPVLLQALDSAPCGPGASSARMIASPTAI